MLHGTKRSVSVSQSQTLEKVENPQQAASLHFVDFALTSARAARLPVRNAKEERSIKAHVMKDYFRQKTQPAKSRNIPAVTLQLSDQVTRFRLPSQQRSRKQSCSKVAHLKPIRSKAHQKSPELALTVPLIKEPLRNVPPLPINNASRPDTLALLEHYYTLYWDNSLAVNPEGKWMSTVLSDGAMFHATLAIVALHRIQTCGVARTDLYFWHRGEAIRLISQNLADPGKITSDATLGAVAVLSALDINMHWPAVTQTSHVQGLITLVRLRGGLDATTINRQVKRAVAWADILHATAQDSLPQMKISQCAANNEMGHLMEVVDQHRYAYDAEADAVVVPAYFREVLEDLRVLAIAKSLLAKATASDLYKLRPVFSSLLFMTDDRILALKSAPAASLDPGNERATGLKAIKAAALIFSFHGLRDVAITAAFYDTLVQRLRDCLYSILEQRSQTPSPDLMPDEFLPASMILWLCLNGWKASTIASRQPDREFFVQEAAMSCVQAGIRSLEALTADMFRIVALIEYILPACKGLWNDVSNLAHPGMTFP